MHTQDLRRLALVAPILHQDLGQKSFLELAYRFAIANAAADHLQNQAFQLLLLGRKTPVNIRQASTRLAGIMHTNIKGCDIGYVLAGNSCEGVNDVETCTVTAPDATTAFAVPSPSALSQVRRFFRAWQSVRVASLD